MSTAPDAPSSPWFVYILRCCDGSLYVGHTADVEQRVQVHNEGRGASWTAACRPVVLLYRESHSTQASAMQRERQLKGWSQAKKLALINGELAALKGLAACRTRLAANSTK